MDYGYSATSYGAQGGNSGGGFMAGSQGEGSAQQKRGYGKDTLRPVTIKQLQDAVYPHPDADHFIIDNSEVTQITFVGQVRNISNLSTNTVYKLDDGTGIIEVKQWIDIDAAQDNDEPSNQKNKPMEEGYVRVWGRLKDFSNKRHVGATCVRPIQNYNEIAYHLLEATAVHLHFVKGPVESLQNQAQNGQNGTVNGHGHGGDAPVQNMSAAARKVLQCLTETPQTNEGLNFNDIANRLGMENNDVIKGADELIALGRIYTTVDDGTWALLDL